VFGFSVPIRPDYNRISEKRIPKIKHVAMVRGTRNIYALAAPLTNNINHQSTCLIFYIPQKIIFYFFM
jgi:hypothetical protein